MKKYLISIESQDSKRLQGFYAQPTFYKYKDDFKQFGIIGKNLSVSQYFEMGVAGKNKAMTPGELGCTLSHLEALKDFLSTNEKYAIIFEDDVIERFEINFDDLENQIENLDLGENFFFSVGGIQMKICNRVRGYDLDKKLYQQKVLKVDKDFLDRLSYAYAYVVDQKMAKMLLEYHQIPRIYDHWQQLVGMQENFNFYVSFVFDHPIVESDNSLSYLERERNSLNFKVTTEKDYLQYLRVKVKRFILNQYDIN
ncbi:glycosyltransferase family 25 protein [Acinetobacter sp. WU_MDCI_Axc73]|nr:glycosyltransferase family 25 protein [Acinetobacter sp. WU_MDCI_Axc73]